MELRKSSPLKPVSQFKANMAWMVLMWSIFRIVYNDPELHPRWLSADGGHLGWKFGSLDIILKVDHLRTIHAMFVLNWLTGFRGHFF
jgi:hypothetical protein